MLKQLTRKKCLPNPLKFSRPPRGTMGNFVYEMGSTPRASDHVSRGWHPFWLLSPPVAPKLIKATKTIAKLLQLHLRRNIKMQSKYASHVDREKRGGEGRETHRANGGILEREPRKEAEFWTPRFIYPNK